MFFKFTPPNQTPEEVDSSDENSAKVLGLPEGSHKEVDKMIIVEIPGNFKILSVDDDPLGQDHIENIYALETAYGNPGFWIKAKHYKRFNFE